MMLLYPNLQNELQWLAQTVHGRRYVHSVGVMEETLALGERFGFRPEDLSLGKIAALLHDCAKQLPFDTMLLKAETYKLSLSPDDLASPQTLHAWVGAAMVASERGISDRAILSAIQAHTTGLANMSDLDILVFVADKIEPRTRDAAWRKDVLAHMPDDSRQSLYKGARYILLNTVERLEAAGQPVHPNTRAALACISRFFMESKSNIPMHMEDTF